MSDVGDRNNSQPNQEEAIPTASFGTGTPGLGGQIGPYKLLSVLGEGGYGIVYLAERQTPVYRRVGLKVIKPGMDTKEVIARFEAERQALALLDHPNIAQVYNAGTTETGRPYFVMEYVRGLPITEHCDREKLTVEERLELFIQVCEGVQHAHQKGIIHRDIKPSNIIVYTEGNKTIPKIIDFGVAKAISQPLTGRTLYTEAGQFVGTPEYMSPEQAEMATQDIDTRSDIYSLGAVLYELLTGALPFDSKTLREGGIEHIRHIIREEEPKTPSTRLTSLGEQAVKVARHRCTEVGLLARRLHRELEWIPLKAMRKERARRYRSASELGDDIENYLQGAPLIAGPESATYRISKFVKRNRALITGIAVVLTVLMAGIVGVTIFAVKAERARAEAQAVSDFLQRSVLTSLNPRILRGKMTARSILDRVSQRLEGQFQDQPLFEASIRQILSSAYGVLGLYNPAELHAERAFEIRRTQLSTEHIDTLYSWYQLGWVYMLQSRFSEAEPFLIKALAGFELNFAEEHGDRVFCMAFLGWVYNYQGRFAEAEELFKKGLAAAYGAGGSEHWQAPFLMFSLALAHRMQGRYEEAESLLRKGLEISLRMYGSQSVDGDTLFLMQSLGALRWDQGCYEEAKDLLEEALVRRREAWGEEYPDTLFAMADLGWLYESQDLYEEAEALFDKALKTAQRTLGDKHVITAFCMHGLGTVYLSQDRCDEAERLLEDALRIVTDLMGEKNWYALGVMNTLSRLYMAQDRDDKAKSLFEETLAERLNKLGESHPASLKSKNDLAVLYKEQGNYTKAEPLLLEALEGRRLKLGDTHPHTKESLNSLIDLYEAWNKPEKAEEWRATLTQKEDFEE